MYILPLERLASSMYVCNSSQQEEINKDGNLQKSELEYKYMFEFE